MQVSRFKFQIIGLLSVFAALLAACGAAYTYHGSLIDPPVTAPDFTLTDHTGQPFTLSQQSGRVTLFFTGYTHCPDVCPATLAQLKQVHAALGGQAEQVQFALLTVDPERDTPERLREYLAAFEDKFIGLTGEVATMEAMWKDYGIYRAKQPLTTATPGHAHGEGALDDYIVDHTTRFYVVDKAGHLRITYTIDVDNEDLVSDLQQLLNEN